jgi:hypothetical protein
MLWNVRWIELLMLINLLLLNFVYYHIYLIAHIHNIIILFITILELNLY